MNLKIFGFNEDIFMRGGRENRRPHVEARVCMCITINFDSRLVSINVCVYWTTDLCTWIYIFMYVWFCVFIFVSPTLIVHHSDLSYAGEDWDELLTCSISLVTPRDLSTLISSRVLKPPILLPFFYFLLSFYFIFSRQCDRLTWKLLSCHEAQYI